MAVQFPAEVQSVRFRQRWHGVSRDGEGEHADHSAALSQKAALQMPFTVTTPLVKMRLERPAEFVGTKPLHLLAQTALPLKSPTGAFIATLRSANAVATNAKIK